MLFKWCFCLCWGEQGWEKDGVDKALKAICNWQKNLPCRNFKHSTYRNLIPGTHLIQRVRSWWLETQKLSLEDAAGRFLGHRACMGPHQGLNLVHFQDFQGHRLMFWSSLKDVTGKMSLSPDTERAFPGGNPPCQSQCDRTLCFFLPSWAVWN